MTDSLLREYMESVFFRKNTNHRENATTLLLLKAFGTMKEMIGWKELMRNA